MDMQKKKKILVIVILALVSMGVWRYWVARKTGQEPLKIHGTIDIRDANLAFPEQERLVQVLVEEGDRVKTGQVLARLDPSRLVLQLGEARNRLAAQQAVVKRLLAGSRPQEIDQARAELAAAQAQWENVQENLTRIQKTSASGASSAQTLDDATSRLQVARAMVLVREKALNLALEGPRREDIAAAESQLAALRDGVALLQVRLDNLTLTAPTDGVIESRILEKGEMAGPTRPVVTLALTDPKWVRAYVPEPDLGRIRPGMAAQVYSDSFPDQPISGWVGFVSPVAEFTPKTIETEDLRSSLVYETRIHVPDPVDRLRLGMPVSVVIDGKLAAKEAASLPKALVPPPVPASDTIGQASLGNAPSSNATNVGM